MCVCVCVCVRARVCAVCSVMSDSLSDSTQTVACQVHGILCPWNSPGKNSNMGSYFLLQGIFLIKGSKL